MGLRLSSDKKQKDNAVIIYIVYHEIPVMQNVNLYIIFPISSAALKVSLVLPIVHLVDQSSSKYFWQKFKKSNDFFFLQGCVLAVLNKHLP